MFVKMALTCRALSVGALFEADGLFQANQFFRRSAPTSHPPSTPLPAHEKELVTLIPTLGGRPPAPMGTAGSVHLRPEFFAKRRLPWFLRVLMVGGLLAIPPLMCPELPLP